MNHIKKQTIILATGGLIFIASAITASYILGSKNQVNSKNHSEHHEEQLAYTDDFNKLIGKQAPDFTLYDYDGKKMKLSEQNGKKVVLFFTEGVMCYPACWNQMAAFGSDSTFKKDNIKVFNIVVDTKKEWENALKKMPELAQTTLLFDSDKKVSKQYGVLSLESSMHKGQYPGHTYLLLDKEGIIRYVKDDPQMAVRNDELKREIEKLN